MAIRYPIAVLIATSAWIFTQCWPISLINTLPAGIGGICGDAEECEAQPGALAYLRFSKRFLQQQIERSVNRKRTFEEEILGTQIQGQSRTEGQVRLVLVPNDERAAAEILFVGTVNSRSRGQNGPAILSYESHADFAVRKRLEFAGLRITSAESMAKAPTRLRATHVETQLPGFLGVVAERIAWRRVAESRAQADRIASQRLEARLSRDLDRRVEKSLAKVNARLKDAFEDLTDESNGLCVATTCRTTNDFIEVVAYCGGPNVQPEYPVFAVDDDADVAVRIHWGAIRLAMSDDRLGELLGPTLNALLQKQIAEASYGLLESAPIATTGWRGLSIGLGWVGADYCCGDRPLAIQKAPSSMTGQQIPARPVSMR
jgi:hypothetical protein